MSLSPPTTVQKLQAALGAKAKGQPGYRFYALYDKVYRLDVLAHAYELCRENRGAPGVDGQTFEAIEASGRNGWLADLAAELKEKTYRLIHEWGGTAGLDSQTQREATAVGHPDGPRPRRPAGPAAGGRPGL
jgi:hypothetical protein